MTLAVLVVIGGLCLSASRDIKRHAHSLHRYRIDMQDEINQLSKRISALESRPFALHQDDYPNKHELEYLEQLAKVQRDSFGPGAVG